MTLQPRPPILWLCLLAANGLAQERSLSDLTGPWQLLIDDHLIAEKTNVVRTFHQFNKLAENPLPSGEVPGTRPVLHVRGGPGYQTWYKGYRYTSPDGTDWQRSERLTYGRVSKGPILHTPWDDGRQFKRFDYDYVLWRTLQPKDPLLKGGFRYGAYSADGLHWTDLNEPLFADRTDVASCIWDSHEQRYLATPKVYTNVRGICRRCIGVSSSREFPSGWPTAELMLVPDPLDDSWVRQPGQRTEFYNLCPFAYETMYLGLLEVFRVTDGVNDGPLFVELVSSRDGVRWDRTPGRGEPILPNGPSGSWDAGMIKVRSHPLVEGETIKLFYYGRDQQHGFGRGYHATRGMEHLIQRGSGIATLRKDGFASIDAAGETGSLTTLRLDGAGGPLAVNFSTRHGGWLKVEVLDAHYKVIPGYRRDQCVPLTGDHVQQQVRWADHQQLPADGRPIRLRFRMQNASIYSFMAGADVIADSRETMLQALYTFESNDTRAASDKLLRDGAHWLHLENQVTVEHSDEQAAFGRRAALFSGDSRQPWDTLELGETFRLGRQFTLAAMVKPVEMDRARLFSSWEPYPKRTNEAPYRRFDSIGNTGLWVGNHELIFDFDPSGGGQHGCLRLVVHGSAVTAIGSFDDGAYHHLAATYDEGDVKLYLDGQQLGRGTVPRGPVTLLANLRVGEDPGPFTVNSAGPTTDEQLKGHVDDILVLGKALTQREIHVLASEGAAALFPSDHRMP